MILNYILTSCCRKTYFVRYFSNHIKTSQSVSTKKLYQWKEPKGHNTGIHIANSYRCLGKQKKCSLVPFIVRNPCQVTWYSCGPTVYDKPHIGNASTYVRFDAIRRVLLGHFDLDINFVMGITDIDDKIIHRATLLDKEFFSMATFYENEFKRAMHNLNVLPPTMYIRVSDVMPQILSFIMQLLENGSAYRGKAGNVWFNVDGFTDLGRLTYILEEWENSETSHLLSEKMSSKDFALWKAAKPGEPYWDTPWGKGRPGWHIECSTIASLVFGNKLDIHSGAQDLFLHHECEVFQCESYHRTEQWVNYFLHSGALLSDSSSVKMSKSLGNVVTVDDFLLTKSADCFRMFCLSCDWNSNLVYKQLSVKTAEKKLMKIRSYLSHCKQYVIGNLDGEVSDVEVAQLLDECKRTVHSSLCNNLNIAHAIIAMQKLCKKVDSMFASDCTETWQFQRGARDSASVLKVYQYVTDMFKLFGFSTVNAQGTSSEPSTFQSFDLENDLQEFRNSVRKIASDMKSDNISYAHSLYDVCDEIRRKLSIRGTLIKDSKV